MSAIERQKYLQQVTQRLIMFTGAVLFMTLAGLYTINKLPEGNKHSYLVMLVFISGLLGGFVSIQQRLPRITVEELRILSSSWLSITLIPINGGIFALVLMLMFLGKIIQGTLFPSYPDIEITSFDITSVETFKTWITSTYPESGAGVAKLLFWSFVAGFSERFVPQIIRRTADDINSDLPTGVDPNKANEADAKKPRG